VGPMNIVLDMAPNPRPMGRCDFIGILSGLRSGVCAATMRPFAKLR